jgi:hypothetical protein
VRSSKPVVRKLGPLLDQLRPFARDAVPTVRDLSQTISAPGAGNDLIELLQAQPPLRDIALGPVEANGKTREGAFPASTRALSSAAPELAFARPYSVDLSAWFDDFSQSGAYDALGSFSRAGLALSAFTFSPVLNSIIPVPPALRPLVFGANTSFGRNNRCPGSDERNPGDNSTTWKPTADFNCDPTQVPVGP